MAETCSIWRECSGDEAVVRIEDEESSNNDLDGRPCCEPCLADLQRDGNMSVKVIEHL
jgi:hypothetical protein